MGLRAYRTLLLGLPLLLGCSNIAGLSSLQEVDTCVGEACLAGVGGGTGGTGGTGGAPGAGGGGSGGASGASGTGGAPAGGSGGKGGTGGAAGLGGKGGTGGASGTGGAGGSGGKGGASGTGGGTGGSAGLGGKAGSSGKGGASGASAGMSGSGGAKAGSGGGGAGGGGSSGASGSAGSGGGCTPSISCAGIGKNCDKIDDGCGNMIDCGTCQAPSVCGMNNLPNVCGCAPGQVYCGADGSVLEQCAADGASLEALGICASAAACSASMGKCTGCTPGSLLCEGKQLVKCNADGVTTAAQGAACSGSTICSPSAPGGCAECVAGGYFCAPGTATLRHCAPDGSSSTYVADCTSNLICQHSVAGGLNHCLTPICNKGDTRCEGASAQVCNANQDGWDLVMTCASAALCQAGMCLPPQCAVGETKCFDTTQMQTCKDDQTGFGPAVPCHAPTPSCDTVGGVGACSVRGPAMVPVTSDDMTKTLYYIDSTEVTDAQYNVFLSNAPAVQSVSKLPAYCSWNSTYGTPTPMPSGRPVVGVDWCDAFAYCQWAQKRLCGKAGPGGQPVDISNMNNSTDIENDEWFRACEFGASKLSYPYGPTYAPTACNGLDAQINSTVVAGSDKSCEGGYGGIFDMSGNVSEWENGCSANLGQNDICNVRGGGYTSPQSDLACASVHTVTRGLSSLKVIGIRCCADP